MKLGDIVFIQTALGGLGIGGFLTGGGKFAVTATHGLLGVFIRQVEVGRVCSQGQDGGDSQGSGGDAPAAHFLVDDGLNQEGSS